MWAEGTAQWQRTRVMIVAADRRRQHQLVADWAEADVLVAATPLEVLSLLERPGPAISTVVLSDVVGSVTRAELADYLEQHYPDVRVIAARPPSELEDDRRSRIGVLHAVQ